MSTRMLRGMAGSAGFLMAAVALVTVPEAVWGGLGLGVFIGLLADLRARSTATGGRQQIAAVGRRAGVTAFGVTVAAWLVGTGALVLGGTVSWALVLIILLAALSSRSGRRLRGRIGGVTAVDEPTVVLPPPVVPAVLSTPELCRFWQRSYLALLDAPAGPARDELVRIRAGLLDELERRDRDGFTRWLDAGARAGSDPGRYLTTER